MKIVEENYKWSGKLSSRKKTDEIILHCSATKEGKDYTVETIDGWHKKRGWSGIGYHYIIYRDGSIHRGRPKMASGAHVTGHNYRSVGVCYIGGVDTNGKAKDTRTAAQKVSMVGLVKELMGIYKLDASHVHCHNEFAAKACPSFKIDGFRKELAE